MDLLSSYHFIPQLNHTFLFLFYYMANNLLFWIKGVVKLYLFDLLFAIKLEAPESETEPGFGCD